MIKQTATYGVWKVDRHDDNKVEVYKNGELCEKSTPALREIAAEIGLELNPEWRTSQLGANVLKAMLNAGEAKPQTKAPEAPKPEPEKETEPVPTPKDEAPNPAKRDFENMSHEQIFKLCVDNDIEALEWLSTCFCEKTIYSVKFISSIKELDGIDQFIENFEKLGGEARIPNNRNALQVLASTIFKVHGHVVGLEKIIEKQLLPYVRYELGSIPAELNEKIEEFKKQNDEANIKRYYNILVPLCWHLLLTKGDATVVRILYNQYYVSDFNKYDYYTIKNDTAKYYIAEAYRTVITDLALHKASVDSEAYKWAEKNLLEDYTKDHDDESRSQKYQDLQKKYGEDVESAIDKLQKSSSNIDNNELIQKYQTLREKYKEVFDKHNEVVRQYNELIDDYNKLVRQVKKDRSDYNKLVDKYQNLEDEYESASSSSSSSDEVRVKISYKTPGFFGSSNNTKYVNMTQDEYKALLKGSMKSRIAYVYGNCGVSRLLDVSDVSISLA